jgi:serine/threonine-protein kinase
LLRYLAERALSGEAINEYAIGVDVFERPASFDPRIESIVRTEAARLRQKLKDYYASEGCGDRVLIEIPLRSYEPAFVLREPEAAPGPPAPQRSSRPQWPKKSRLILAALALLAGGAELTIWLSRTRPNPPIHSLVVLPFQNLSPDAADEYLSDGLTDELTSELANWKEVRVVARTSAYQYKGKGEDVRRIGREVNADAVLEGSLTRQGERVRINAQLNRTSDGYHLWSHSYDTGSRDMLTVQSEIAQAIAGAIRRLGVRVPNQISRPATNNPEALDLYLRASYQYARLSPVSLQASIGLFQAAIEKDPGYARAYVGLAAAELESVNFDATVDSTALARAALQQALRLDPDSGDAHGLLAEIVTYFDWDWPRGEREFQTALEKGAQPGTRAAYGWTLARYGRYAEAQAQCAAAENLEPLGVAPRFCEFYLYYYQHQFARARQILLEVLEVKPDLIYAHALLGKVALAQHDCAEAARQFQWSAQRLPAPAATIGLGYVCACRGERDRARAYLRRAAGSSPSAEPAELAVGYAMLHDSETAMGYLRKSATERRVLPGVLTDPLFDTIRTDPRYLALEKTAGLVR